MTTRLNHRGYWSMHKWTPVATYYFPASWDHASRIAFLISRGWPVSVSVFDGVEVGQ